MARVTLTFPARDDLDSTWDFIAKDNVAAADRLVDQMNQLCELDATQPNAGTPADQFQSGLRYFPVGSYVVFYRPEDDGILVIRILHGARNIKEIFRR